MQTVPTTVCDQHIGRIRAGCAECVVDKLKDLLKQWRDEVINAAKEPCEVEVEHNCICVGLLRKQLADLVGAARVLISAELEGDDDGKVCILLNNHDAATAFVRMLEDLS